MNLENIKKHFQQTLKRIENLRYRDPRYSSSVRGITELRESIRSKVSDLKELSVIISDFNSIEFSKDELTYIEYIDNDGALDKSAIKNIHAIIDKLESAGRMSGASLRGKNNEITIQQLSNELFNYTALKPTSRIQSFLDGKLVEGLAWQDGLIIRLDTANHVNSIANLNVQINQLHRILRAFSRLNKSNESDFEIYKLETGSLLITITTIAGIVITLGKATNYILDSIKKVYEIKKHAVELKKLKSESLKDVITNLEKAATIDNKTSEEIAIKLISESGYDESDKNEVLTFLIKANEYLFKLYDEGGEIKLLVNPIARKDESVNEVILNTGIKTKELINVREEMKKILSKKDLKVLNIKFNDESSVA